MKNLVIEVFKDVDMRLQHHGLKALASEKKVDLDKLENGQHVLFLNSKLNRVKMYSKSNVLSYIYKEKGTIDLRYIYEIPKAFNQDGTVSFDKAVKSAIESALARKGRESKS